MSNLEGVCVVTAKEMARVEALAIAEGSSAEQFMLRAGREIAQRIENFIEANGCVREVILLVGKGNNGGDAYTAGVFLLQKGLKVVAYHVFPLDSCSALCQKQHYNFVELGGLVEFINPHARDYSLPKQGVVVDGLVGTGFAGEAKGLLAAMIVAANQSGLPVIAIDIPSGVNGNTGEVGSIAIEATVTVYLEFPKLGFFLRQGYDHIGDLQQARFGLPAKYAQSAQADAHLFSEEAIHACLPHIHRTQNKYSRGYVIGVAGSTGMTGAAVMSCLGAMRSGAGIVRLFHSEEVQEEFAAAPLELIREAFDFENPAPILKEAKRAGCLFFGPGIGKDKSVEPLLAHLLHKLQIPMVIDADGIEAIAKIDAKKFPANCVITPHRGELKKLLHANAIEEEELLKQTQAFVEAHHVTIVYKGAPTWIFHPHTLPLILPVGDPGMATAGSGDVLTGVIAAILAQGLSAREAAVVGVVLHGAAGKIAAQTYTSRSLIATDIISALPQALASF